MRKVQQKFYISCSQTFCNRLITLMTECHLFFWKHSGIPESCIFQMIIDGVVYLVLGLLSSHKFVFLLFVVSLGGRIKRPSRYRKLSEFKRKGTRKKRKKKENKKKIVD
ncbi:uncharacterized protein LOC111059393 [Nilaparvata lugens]|uniref:uncharacterized protein LOC111059393 n=1 Tax=Nilaparvata lugens TaxID=108931 RepID=UPI00193D35C5|nr:uncharacterized protein LOC111059393 [Nilaparvata lugens]